MKLIHSLQSFARDEEGAAALEYGLIAALIAVVIMANIETIGTDLNKAFKSIADTLPT